MIRQHRKEAYAPGSSIPAAPWLTDTTLVRLKDADNCAFLDRSRFDEDVCRRWHRRVGLLRRVDQMSEPAQAGRDGARFRAFCADWRFVVERGSVPTGSRFAGLIECLRADGLHERGEGGAEAFLRFLEALERYSRDGISLATIADFDEMLTAVGGFFAVLPYLRESQREAMWLLGAADQGFNVLRDIEEDRRAGMCLLPDELLDANAVRREDVLSGRCIDTPAFAEMLRSFVSGHLVDLRDRVQSLPFGPGYHASLRALRTSCLRRYHRVQMILDDCDYDVRRFRVVYWSRLRSDFNVPRGEGSAFDDSDGP